MILNYQQGNKYISNAAYSIFPRYFLDVSVHFLFLGDLPILKFLLHLDVQKYNTWPDLFTNILPLPSGMGPPQKEHFGINTTIFH